MWEGRGRMEEGWARETIMRSRKKELRATHASPGRKKKDKRKDMLGSGQNKLGVFFCCLHTHLQPAHHGSNIAPSPPPTIHLPCARCLALPCLALPLPCPCDGLKKQQMVEGEGGRARGRMGTEKGQTRMFRERACGACVATPEQGKKKRRRSQGKLEASRSLLCY